MLLTEVEELFRPSLPKVLVLSELTELFLELLRLEKRPIVKEYALLL